MLCHSPCVHLYSKQITHHITCTCISLIVLLLDATQCSKSHIIHMWGLTNCKECIICIHNLLRALQLCYKYADLSQYIYFTFGCNRIFMHVNGCGLILFIYTEYTFNVTSFLQAVIWSMEHCLYPFKHITIVYWSSSIGEIKWFCEGKREKIITCNECICLYNTLNFNLTKQCSQSPCHSEGA